MKIRLTDFQRNMVEKNLKLAYHALNNVKFRPLVRMFLDYSDAEQVAVMGLIKAVQTFEFPRKIKLSTWIYWWVRNALQYYSNHEFIVRKPHHRKLSFSIFELSDKLESGLEAPPIAPELNKEELDLYREHLTDRQKEVWDMYLEGIPLRQMARKMGVNHYRPCLIMKSIKHRLNKLCKT